MAWQTRDHRELDQSSSLLRYKSRTAQGNTLRSPKRPIVVKWEEKTFGRLHHGTSSEPKHPTRFQTSKTHVGINGGLWPLLRHHHENLWTFCRVFHSAMKMTKESTAKLLKYSCVRDIRDSPGCTIFKFGMNNLAPFWTIEITALQCLWPKLCLFFILHQQRCVITVQMPTTTICYT